MRRIDYDTEQYQDYARGRALTEHQLQTWISAFGAVLPERRPLAGLDVGSGTGRFTPALVREFGPVTGVEPSVRMREMAQARSPHPGVRYLAGSAEEMPVESGSADYALMFLSWHHVRDKPRAARELARVVRPAGRLLLRANFSDHHPRPWWLEHFPRGFEADASVPAAARGHRDVSRRPTGASPASARSTSRPPAPAVTCSNDCACAPFRSSPSSAPTNWRPASATWSRPSPQIPTHQHPCSLREQRTRPRRPTDSPLKRWAAMGNASKAGTKERAATQRTRRRKKAT
jgi:SAM-dependent methyltransferase